MGHYFLDRQYFSTYLSLKLFRIKQYNGNCYSVGHEAKLRAAKEVNSLIDQLYLKYHVHSQLNMNLLRVHDVFNKQSFIVSFSFQPKLWANKVIFYNIEIWQIYLTFYEKGLN